MAKNKKESIIVRICQEYAKCSNGEPIKNGVLEISLADYIKFIEWDCENACQYYPDLLNPTPIMGLKVKLKKDGELKIHINKPK